MKDRILSLLRRLHSLDLETLRNTLGEEAVTAALALIAEGKLVRTDNTVRLP